MVLKGERGGSGGEKVFPPAGPPGGGPFKGFGGNPGGGGGLLGGWARRGEPPGERGRGARGKGGPKRRGGKKEGGKGGEKDFPGGRGEKGGFWGIWEKRDYF